MKRLLAPITLIFSAFLLFGTAAAWTLSYRAPHSLRFSQRIGEIQVLADRGIIQVDFLRGDPEDRGFQWDAHRRSAAWGRTSLDTFKPTAGLGRFFADLGFAGWSYERHFGGWFSDGLPGYVVFFPFWFVIPFPLLLLVWQIRAEASEKDRRRAGADDTGVMFRITGFLRGRLASLRRAAFSNPPVCPP